MQMNETQVTFAHLQYPRRATRHCHRVLTFPIPVMADVENQTCLGMVQVVEKMFAEKRPCVVDFHIEREENVWPMVAAGKGLHEMTGLPTDSVERL